MGGGGGETCIYAGKDSAKYRAQCGFHSRLRGERREAAGFSVGRGGGRYNGEGSAAGFLVRGDAGEGEGSQPGGWQQGVL